QFSYLDLPAVSHVIPGSGPAAGGYPVILTGSGFLGATAVHFGSVPATSFLVVTDGQITAVAPAGTAGDVHVLVTTPGGSSLPSTTHPFSDLAQPALAALGPSSGPAAGGTSVVITGSGLTAATAVPFGIVPATSFHVDSPTQITAVAPPGVTGTVHVRVL